MLSVAANSLVFTQAMEVSFTVMRLAQHIPHKQMSRLSLRDAPLKMTFFLSVMMGLLAMGVILIFIRLAASEPAGFSQATVGSAQMNVKTRALAERPFEQTDVAATTAFGDLVFVGADRAYLQNYKGEILLTKDAGASWMTVGGDIPKDFDAFTMLDNRRGWAVDNEGRIWKTSDSCYNWDSISRLERQDPAEFYMSASQILFTDEFNGWVIDSFAVWRTRDGGLSWQEVDQLAYRNLKNRVRRISFHDSRFGWAECDKGLVIQTDNGGDQWRSMVDSLSFNIGTTIEATQFLNKNKGWMAVSDAPEPYPAKAVLFTEDGGKNWQTHNNFGGQDSISNIFFLDEKIGWMAGSKILSNADSEIGLLLQTQDAGQTWRRVRTVPNADAIKSVRFTSLNEGWLTTDYNVYRTHDGGKKWLTVLSYPEIKSRNTRILGSEESNEKAHTN